jgi:hypothetical protein
MNTISRSVSGQPSEQRARAQFQRIGGAREFSTFAILVLCLAIAVGFVAHRDHLKVKGTAPRPATATHKQSAPKPQTDAPLRSLASLASNDDYQVSISTSAANLNYSAQAIIYMAINPVWDLALGVSNQILAYVANSLVYPVTGDRVIFNAAPAMFNLAVQILALAMVTVLMMALAGPVYVSWKSWRQDRAHLSR